MQYFYFKILKLIIFYPRSHSNENLDFVVAKRKGKDGILIDSTGIPNSIHFPLTAICNHNGGLISGDIRIKYVVKQNIDAAIILILPGNVIDISTLNMLHERHKIYSNLIKLTCSNSIL